MQKIIIWAILFAPIALYAQVDWGLKINTGVGYEHNIFNAPTFLENDTINPVNNGIFHYAQVRLNGSYQIKKHQWKWSGRSITELFPTFHLANVWDWKAEGKYSWQMQKKMQISVASYVRNKRNGDRIDVASDILIPRSYQQRYGALSYLLQSSKRQQFNVQFHRTYKTYGATSTSELTYQETGITLKTIRKFKQQGKTSSQLRIELKGYQRFYKQYKWNEDLLELEAGFLDEEDFFEAAEEVTERFWRYLNSLISYRFYLTKRSRFKVGIASQQRFDLYDELLGYHQITSFTVWTWDHQTWTIKWKNAYTRRNFSDLFIDKKEEKILCYQYLRSSLELQRSLEKNWLIQGSIGVVKRWSNSENLARRSYRGYLNIQAKLGVVYQLN